jgi:uncharacterized protein YbaR (Trm112 family)
MISPEFLAILRCPEDHTKLTLADSALVQRLNTAVASKELKNRSGQAVEKPLDGGLLRADGQVLYPIIDRIPILLVDEGILVGSG